MRGKRTTSKDSGIKYGGSAQRELGGRIVWLKQNGGIPDVTSYRTFQAVNFSVGTRCSPSGPNGEPSFWGGGRDRLASSFNGGGRKGKSFLSEGLRSPSHNRLKPWKLTG